MSWLIYMQMLGKNFVSEQWTAFSLFSEKSDNELLCINF